MGERRHRLSVVIPCHNVGAWLPETLDSIFAQTVQDFELLLVDDGSDDPHTLRLFESLRRPRTRVLRATHRGIGGARNVGLAEATADVVCFMDGDDLLAPTYFEQTLEVLETQPEISFVSTWVQMFGAETHLWKQSRCDLGTLLAECTLNAPAPMRRAAIERVGGYDESFGSFNEDWDLWIRLVAAGYQGMILQAPLYHYRRRADSASAQLVGERHFAHLRRLHEKHSMLYQAHAVAVGVHKDAQLAEVAQQRAKLEHEVRGQLEPRLQQRQAELARLESVLASASAHGSSRW